MIKNSCDEILLYYQQLLDQTKLLHEKVMQDSDLQLDFIFDNRQRLINIITQKSQVLKSEPELEIQKHKIIQEIKNLDLQIGQLIHNSKENTIQELSLLYQNKKKLQGYNLQKVNRR